MNILIKKPIITDLKSEYNGKSFDILIEGGIIKSIKKNIKAEKGIKTIEKEGLHVSIGWMDMQVDFCDPGHEYKEDLSSGIKAASAGGFTAVALMPSTYPVMDTKQGIEYIKNKAKNSIVDVYPVGCLSQKMEGKDIAEMYDMHLAGAAAFSDDKKPVMNSGLMLRALLYSKNFNGLIIAQCNDTSITRDGKMNEGETSTALGLKGMPALAEEAMAAQYLYLLEYTGGRLHIPSVSSKGTVELIRQAKKKKLNITAGVNAYNLYMNDMLLEGFDSNYKVNPPLRSKEDIKALQIGLADGTIDVITSDHRPQEIEAKKKEYDLAEFGMIGVQTAFALANMGSEKLSLDKLISKITYGPRKALGLNIPEIKEGSKANLTLFDPNKVWELKEKDILSKSKNTPLIGEKLKGKALGIYNQKSLLFFQ